MTPDNPNRTGARWLSPIVHLSNNWISLAGVVIVTTATILWLFLLPITLRGTENPYLGILAYMGLPAPFFLGLILIPLGMWIQRRREGRAALYPSDFPRLAWSNPELRRLAYFIGATTVINVVVASQL